MYFSIWITTNKIADCSLSPLIPGCVANYRNSEKSRDLLKQVEKNLLFHSAQQRNRCRKGSQDEALPFGGGFCLLFCWGFFLKKKLILYAKRKIFQIKLRNAVFPNSDSLFFFFFTLVLWVWSNILLFQKFVSKNKNFVSKIKMLHFYFPCA